MKTDPVIKAEPMATRKTDYCFKTEAIPPAMAEPEDVDDPDDPPAVSTSKAQGTSDKIVAMQKSASCSCTCTCSTTTLETNSQTDSHKPGVERKGFNCIVCSKSKKDGRNLTIESIKSHMNVCITKLGDYQKILPPKHINGELEQNYKYFCRVEGCSKNTSKVKEGMTYIHFVMHAAASHDVLERILEISQLDGAQELYKALKNLRAGVEIQSIPNYEVEEIFQCPVCQGENSDGNNLSFSSNTKSNSVRYHISGCIYDEGDFYLKKFRDINPHENFNEDGSVKFDLNTFYFNCKSKTCKKQSRMCFKSYVIHQAYQHGVLEEILRDHPDPDVRKFVPKLRPFNG